MRRRHFTDADLSEARLERIVLMHASLHRADLRAAYMSNAALTLANLSLATSYTAVRPIDPPQRRCAHDCWHEPFVGPRATIGPAATPLGRETSARGVDGAPLAWPWESPSKATEMWV